MVMQRWAPFRDLRNMEDMMNRLCCGFNGSPTYREGAKDWNRLINVVQKKGDIVVKASMPGVKPEGIDVAVEDNVLTLRAERKPEIEGEEATYLIQKRPTGSFYRALRLPDTVDANKIQCNYDNGVLTINLSKAEEKKKKQTRYKWSNALCSF